MEQAQTQEQGSDMLSNIVISIIIVVFLNIIYKALTFTMRSKPVKVFGTIGLFGFLIIGFCSLTNKAENTKILTSVTISVSRANLRFTPTTVRNKPIDTAKRGTTFVVAKTKGKWINVEHKGKKAWLHSSTCKKNFNVEKGYTYNPSDVNTTLGVFGGLYLFCFGLGIVLWIREEQDY
jgi:hypothetical protein